MISKPRRDDYDTTWKNGVMLFFEEFMRFFFPDAHDAIDWPRGFTFLDKELNQITRGAKRGQDACGHFGAGLSERRQRTNRRDPH